MSIVDLILTLNNIKFGNIKFGRPNYKPAHQWQGQILIILGRRQLTTFFFFSRLMQNCGRQKDLLKCFPCSETELQKMENSGCQFFFYESK